MHYPDLLLAAIFLLLAFQRFRSGGSARGVTLFAIAGVLMSLGAFSRFSLLGWIALIPIAAVFLDDWRAAAMR